MNERLQGKSALVTGAASGIGRRIATRFVQEGANVLFADIDEAGLSGAAEGLDPTRVTTAIADITRESDVVQMLQDAVDRFTGLDVAVNCAFGLRPTTPPAAGSASSIPFCEEPTERFAAVVEVGLTAPFCCIRHEARQMASQDAGGSIINVVSINARQPAEGMSSYCAAKAGLEMLTRCAALELGPHGVRVTAIGPGLIDTPMTSFLTSSPELLGDYLGNVPLGRVGTPDDIASAAVFLASDEAAWISGATLYVDGGQLTARVPPAPGTSQGLPRHSRAGIGPRRCVRTDGPEHLDRGSPG